MRVPLLFVSVAMLWPAAVVAQVESTVEPLNFAGKTDYFVRTSFSPEALAGVGSMTAIGHLAGDSGPWGTGATGYGRRMRANYAGYFANTGLRYALGAARGEDPRFYPSGKDGFLARTAFVLSRTFVVRMDDGSTSVAAGRLAGTFAGSTVSTYLRHSHPGAWQTTFENTGITLGADVGVRMAREFWPDIRGVFRR